LIQEMILENGPDNANTRRETEKTRILERQERSEDAAPFALEIMARTAMKRP